ncbi:hypothetical protein HDU97_006735 [Phlyctochytrium planicorne]|nr:hypothetical protein HDU97_006735 [Phlyctochytrium planicorne]
MHEILDAVRVSDFVVLVMSAAVEVDAEGTKALTAVKAQGVPSLMGVVQHLEKDTEKEQLSVRKSLLSYMEAHFPGYGAKLFSLKVESESSAFIRHVTASRPKTITWREKHGYIIADSISFVSGESEEHGTLKVTGYLRGSSLSANRLIHIPHYGDFQIERIEDAKVSHGMETDCEILDTPSPEFQDSLISENEPNVMDAEQTWPTEEELEEAERRVAENELQKKKKRTVRVPKGTSPYQAAWIVDDDDDENQSSSDVDDRDSDDDMQMGEGSQGVDEQSNEIAFEDEEFEEIELEGGREDFDTDFNVLDDERQYAEYLESKKKRALEDLEFPDEVDTPRHIPARTRFGRYRGLKSLRTSPWDCYENLPVDYSRIFQFQNFRKTRERIFQDLNTEGVESGERISIYIQNVPRCVLVSCFSAHRIDPVSTSAPIIKSKEEILIQFGFRKYVIRPIYCSENRGSVNNVARFERFFHQGRTTLGTFYGPVVMDNEPVLLYRLNADRTIDENGLIATGKMVPPSPTRIIAKRILLTGHPFKINKRSAVIRYMFFNPTDVNYFKPIQLHTKMGRVGHIKESLGTHGYMKCIFDEQLKAQDTVCLSLYKRVFPKWGTELWKGEGSKTVSEDMEV